MFRPIKSFFSYMQKNAIKSPAEIGETADVAIEALEDKLGSKDKKPQTQKQKPELASEQLAKRRKSSQDEELEEEVMKTSNYENPKESKEKSTSIKMHCFEEEDDIELQIKSSLVKKPNAITQSRTIPMLNGKNVTVRANTYRKLELITPPSHAPPDHNQNHALENDEMLLKQYRRTPLAPIVDDIYSVDSSEPTEEEEEEVEGEGEEDMAKDFSIDEDDDEEIVPFVPIVAVCDELPDELHSPVPTESITSEDPLAIDGLTPSKLNSSITSECSNTEIDLDMWVGAENDVKTTHVSRSLFSPTISATETETSTTTTTTAAAAAVPLQSVTEDVEVDIEAVEINSDKNLPLPPNSTEITIKTTTGNGEEQVEELRSDGSDSGLGSESAIQNLRTIVTESPEDHELGAVGCTTMLPCVESVIDTTVASTTTAVVAVSVPEPITQLTVPCASQKPLRSNLKRRLDCESMPDGPSTSAAALALMSKKPRRNVSFNSVTLFYFPRMQGFGCVPSIGGCTLGMEARHVASKQLSLLEHAAETRRAHRTQLQERLFSSDDSEESEEDFLSEGSGSDLDGESTGFCQPVSPKVRRAMLKAAGVRRIDPSEKIECRNIRNSREICGCSCREFCDPDTCTCSISGIECQVDRSMFPCGCTRDGCGNSFGRVEFNPNRVRTHFIHTLMRLELESRPQQNRPLCDGSTVDYATTTSNANVREQSHSMVNGFYGMQPQSNYSSGYGSPVYSSDSTPSYYLPQSTHCNGNQQSSPYSVDSLDAGWTNCTNFENLSYATISGMQSQVLPPFEMPSTYHTQTPALSLSSSTTTLTSNFVSPKPTSLLQATATIIPSTTTITNYSSCAVPSEPPFGTATTTESVPNYQTTDNTIYTNSQICVSGIDIEGNSSSYINPTTPLVSSSRLTQINDLLQQNHNNSVVLIPTTTTTTPMMTSNNENDSNISSRNDIDKKVINFNVNRSADATMKFKTVKERMSEKIAAAENAVENVVNSLKFFTSSSSAAAPPSASTTEAAAAVAVAAIDDISECLTSAASNDKNDKSSNNSCNDINENTEPKVVVKLDEEEVENLVVEEEKSAKMKQQPKPETATKFVENKEPKQKKISVGVQKQNQKLAAKPNEKLKIIAKKSSQPLKPKPIALLAVVGGAKCDEAKTMPETIMKPTAITTITTEKGADITASSNTTDSTIESKTETTTTTVSSLAASLSNTITTNAITAKVAAPTSTTTTAIAAATTTTAVTATAAITTTTQSSSLNELVKATSK